MRWVLAKPASYSSLNKKTVKQIKELLNNYPEKFDLKMLSASDWQGGPYFTLKEAQEAGYAVVLVVLSSEIIAFSLLNKES